MLLYVESAFYIYIADDVFSLFELFVYLLRECTVETSFVHLLIFKEIPGIDVAAELFRREEEVFHTVLFVSAGRTAGATDAEMKRYPFLY